MERVQSTLRELAKALKSLPGGSAPEWVHKLRTAIRRVEAIAAALPQEGKKPARRLLRAIEPVRKASGEVRDLDVLRIKTRKLARRAPREGIERLIGRIESDRERSAVKLRRAFERRCEDARKHLKQYAKQLGEELGAANSGGKGNGLPIEEMHAAAMESLRELGAWPPLEEANLHGFRLKVKRLRYILQMDAESEPALLETLGLVQRRVGDWHDWLQLETLARATLDAEQDAALLERIGKTTKRRFNQAMKAANGFRGKYLTAPRATGI